MFSALLIPVVNFICSVAGVSKAETWRGSPHNAFRMPPTWLVRVRVAGLSVAVISVAGAACNSNEALRYSEARPLMGTLVQIDVAGAGTGAARPIVDSAFQRMARLSDSMNVYNPDSQVSLINRRAGREFTEVSPDLLKVLELAEAMSQRTKGAFDITVGSIRGWHFDPENPSLPEAEDLAQQLTLVNFRNVVIDRLTQRVMLHLEGMRIDLGGIAKLAVLNAGCEVLRQRGIRSAMINGGGDIVAFSSWRDSQWRVGIRDPSDPDQLFAQLDVSDAWIVSSGDYERYFIRDGQRYHHILDPRTGYPTKGLRQVTLVGQRWEDLSGLSAAIMVLGRQAGIEVLHQSSGISGLMFEADGQVWASRGLPELLSLSPALANFTGFRIF